MSTLSVPLSDGQRAKIKRFVKQGIAPTEAEFVRQAIQQYTEELAVNTVLKSYGEPSLTGDIDNLAHQLDA